MDRESARVAIGLAFCPRRGQSLCCSPASLDGENPNARSFLVSHTRSAHGLANETLVGCKAYGPVADALLGITGSFAVDWILAVLTHTSMSRSDSALLTIWGAAAFFARAKPHGGCKARL